MNTPPSGEIFSFLGVPTGETLRVKGPMKMAPNKGPLQINGAPTDKQLIQTKNQGPLQTKDPYGYRRCVIPTDKGATTNLGPLWTIKGPYRQLGAYADKEPLYRQEALTDKGPLQTKNPYRRCVIHTDKGPLQTIQSIQTLGGPTYKGSIQTIYNSYRQGAYTNKEPLQTRGPTDAVKFLHIRGPYRQRTPI